MLKPDVRSLSACQWIFLALAGHVTVLLGVAIHELAHGIAALTLGGDFNDLFISSNGGQAGAIAPGKRNLVVLAAGSITEIIAGFTAWHWLRRRDRVRVAKRFFDPIAILLWLFAAQAVLGSLAYISFAPALQAVIGVTAGDWPLLFASQPGLRWVIFGAGVLAVGPISAGFLKCAPQLISLQHEGVRGEPASTAFAYAVNFVMLLLPSRILHTATGIVLLPWLDSWFGTLVGRTLLILLFAVAGGVWLAWRMHGRSNADLTSTRDPRNGTKNHQAKTRFSTAGYWNAGLAVVAAAVLWVFGPTDDLRRGLMILPPGPDDYIGVAQRIRLELALQDAASPDVLLCSEPLQGAGSTYRRELTQLLAPQGPSVAGAYQLAAFIAQWNLGNALVGEVSVPTRVGGDWCWRFRLEGLSNPVQVALWPVTWNSESHISSVRIIGGRTDTPVPNLTVDPAATAVLLWTRPEGMSTVQRFTVYRQ